MQRAVWAVGLAGLACFGGGAACGGESERQPGDASQAGAGGSTSTGGNAGMLGKAGQVGRSGQAGSAGAGGRVGLCDQELSTRGCEGGRWFAHDPRSDECIAVVGCSNNDNHFVTLEACWEACPSSRPDLATCAHAYDCVIVDTTCCAACEPIDIVAKTAVNQSRQWQFIDSRPCSDGCEDCAPVDELERTGQYVIPACDAGRCTVTTVTQRSCTVDSDCFLRDGADCCDPCDGVGIVALSSLDYLADVCDPSVDCVACESLPADLTAVCREGQCEVAHR